MQIIVLASLRENYDRYLWKHLLAFYLMSNRPPRETKYISAFEVFWKKGSELPPKLIRRQQFYVM